MGSGSYHGVEEAFVLEVGKITMAGAMLEDLIYAVGEDLSLDSIELRRRSGGDAAVSVRNLVHEKGALPWFAASVTVDRIAQWCSDSKGALNSRGKVVHAISHWKREGDEAWTAYRRETGTRQGSEPLDLKATQRLRDRLDALVVEGFKIAKGILPLIAPKVYMHLYGPATGAIVFAYEEGSWPERPGTKEEADALLLRTWEWCKSLLNGEETPVRMYNSPEGAKIVAPWV